ncbi:hypothetical protein l13_00710 [Neisseria weaveri ATCC 51223]|nr:hypothetical protein l13_00710 [Neisseria weaveri ATCC 51223]
MALEQKPEQRVRAYRTHPAHGFMQATARYIIYFQNNAV